MLPQSWPSPTPIHAPCPHRSKPPLISVVIPVFNEQAVLQECHNRLTRVMDRLPVRTEIIYIDDGSSDETLQILQELRKRDSRVCILELSRNFGKEAAMSAGLDHADGDAVIVMDADLQDPPEFIPRMLEEWSRGHDVVYLRRRSRQGESVPKKICAYVYYRLLNRLSRIKIPEDVGDFRLLSRCAVVALRRLPERNRYMKGLYAWIGFSQKELVFDRDSRAAGYTKWGFRSLLNLSLDGLTAFTTAPLKLASYLGLLVSGGAFAYGIWIIAKTLLYGETVSGFPTIMVVMLCLGGVQLMAIGVLGEYLGRMFMENKQRPLYLIKQHLPAEAMQGVNDKIEMDVPSHVR